MISAAAKLAVEAREIEKANNSVMRKPHGSKGQTMWKTDLMVKPE